MLDAYLDIRDRIDEEPAWFDRHGVPRYGEFSPYACSDVYAKEVLLLEIGCQECGQRFLVEFTWGPWLFGKSLVEQVAVEDLPHYGDPPRHGFDGSCGAGDTMNSVEPRVVGLWRRERFDWREVDVEALVAQAQEAEQAQGRRES